MRTTIQYIITLLNVYSVLLSALTFVCIKLNQISKDIKYIRVIVDEIEDTIGDRTWVVYENDEYMH